jgi:hypothetical protein
MMTGLKLVIFSPQAASIREAENERAPRAQASPEVLEQLGGIWNIFNRAGTNDAIVMVRSQTFAIPTNLLEG